MSVLPSGFLLATLARHKRCQKGLYEYCTPNGKDQFDGERVAIPDQNDIIRGRENNRDHDGEEEKLGFPSIHDSNEYQ